MTDFHALLEQRRTNLRKWAVQAAEQGDYREAAAYQIAAGEVGFLLLNTQPTTEQENTMNRPIRYRKKPVVVEVMRLTTENASEVAEWCSGQLRILTEQTFGGVAREYVTAIEIPTLEGVMVGQFGDYVIRGVQGEFYPCKPDIFEATYEPEAVVGS